MTNSIMICIVCNQTIHRDVKYAIKRNKKQESHEYTPLWDPYVYECQLNFTTHNFNPLLSMN